MAEKKDIAQENVRTGREGVPGSAASPLLVGGKGFSDLGQAPIAQGEIAGGQPTGGGAVADEPQAQDQARSEQESSWASRADRQAFPGESRTLL